MATKSQEACRDNCPAEEAIVRLCSRFAIRLDEDHPKSAEARQIAEAMIAWPNRKSPD